MTLIVRNRLAILLGLAWLGALSAWADDPPVRGAARAAGADRSKLYDVYHVKFETPDARSTFVKEHADFKKDGVSVFTAFDCFADAFVEPARGNEFKKAVKEAGGWAESGGDVWVPPPRVAIAPGKPRSEPERIFRGDPKLRGKGVVVAVIDSGIDFRHEDFVRIGPGNERTSRILYLWDTTEQAPEKGPGSRLKSKVLYPTGEPIGTIYTQEELTAELNARPEDRRIPDTDTNGHGTACAGVAAGGGRVNPDLRGVAPDADIIAVRIGRERRFFTNAYLANAACGWIDEMAGKKSAVVSCSWGGQYGTHDGRMVVELQLSARFPLDRPGRAICFSAGNEGQVFIHAETLLAGDTKKAPLKWKAPQGGRINLYFDTQSEGDAEVKGDGITILRHEVNRVTKNLETEIHLKGPGELQILRHGSKDLQADAYILGDGAEFVQHGLALRKQVGSPGMAFNPITIGSYDWNDVFPKAPGKTVPLFVQKRNKDNWAWVDMTIGELSSYSSPGPGRLVQRDNPKPNIVAPGQYFIAPCSAMTAPDDEGDIVRSDDRKYRDFNGTSASTPYVAGVIALFLEAKPSLTLGEIKTLMRKNASKVPDMQKRPDSWGYGKLDRQAVERILEELQPERAGN